MIFLSVFLSIIVPTVTGFFISEYFLKNDPETAFFEKLLLGFGIGSGLQTIFMFLIGLANFSYTINIFLFIHIILWIALYKFAYSSRCHRDLNFWSFSKDLHVESGWKFYLSIFILTWISLRMGFVFYECLTRPIFTWDSWIHWSSGAKFFFHNKGLVLDYSQNEHYFGNGYRYIGHPILFPLLQVWTALWIGEFHEVYVKIWSAFYLTGILGILFYAIRKETTWFYSLIAIYLFSGLPLFIYHGTDAYSDLPLSFYVLVSTIYFFKYLRTGDKRVLLLSGISLAMAAFTKNEGLIFLAAISLALFFHVIIEKKKGVLDILYFLLSFSFIAAPWMFFKFINGFGYGHGGQGSVLNSGFSWFSDPTFGTGISHNMILPIIFKQFFFTANFSLLFPFWILMTLISFKQIIRTELKYLYLILLFVISSFLFIYFTLEMAAVTQVSGLHRNALTYTPIIFYTVIILLTRTEA